MKNLQGYQCCIFNRKAKYSRFLGTKWDPPLPNNNSIVVNPIMSIDSLNTIFNTKTSEMVPLTVSPETNDQSNEKGCPSWTKYPP